LPDTGDGCGLGLSIVREIALAHGATVHLEEREAGTGARFVIQFGHHASTKPDGQIAGSEYQDLYQEHAS